MALKMPDVNKKGNKKTKMTIKELQNAVENGDLNILSEYYKNGQANRRYFSGKNNKTWHSLLNLAIMNNELKIAKLLIQNGETLTPTEEYLYLHNKKYSKSYKIYKNLKGV